VLTAVEAAATVAFARSVLPQAARKRLDAVGVCMVAGLGAFGGVVRDIVCPEIPGAFRDHRPYARCTFAGGRVLVGLQALGAPDTPNLLAAAAGAASLRGLPLLTGWTLPGWPAADRRD
jgi:uncharacterized membrane protein YeiH